MGNNRDFPGIPEGFITHENMHGVNLVGWRKGALAITGMKILQAHTEMSLTQAKSAIERCLSGEKREFFFATSGGHGNSPAPWIRPASLRNSPTPIQGFECRKESEESRLSGCLLPSPTDMRIKYGLGTQVCNSQADDWRKKQTFEASPLTPSAAEKPSHPQVPP